MHMYEADHLLQRHLSLMSLNPQAPDNFISPIFHVLLIDAARRATIVGTCRSSTDNGSALARE